jgi:hypothetical protein
MTLLERLGPARGYYPESANSIIICSPADMAAATSDIRKAHGMSEASSERRPRRRPDCNPRSKHGLTASRPSHESLFTTPRRRMPGCQSRSKRSGNTCTELLTTSASTSDPLRTRWQLFSYRRYSAGRTATSSGTCSPSRFESPEPGDASRGRV